MELKICTHAYCIKSACLFTTTLINPLCACAARVTVVGSVCLCVVTQHLTSPMFFRLTNDTTYLTGKQETLCELLAGDHE